MPKKVNNAQVSLIYNVHGCMEMDRKIENLSCRGVRGGRESGQIEEGR